MFQSLYWLRKWNKLKQVMYGGDEIEINHSEKFY